MIILKLLPLIAMLFATILSFVYIIDMFINIKKQDRLKLLKRQRTMALWLTGFNVFILFFHIGFTGTLFTLVALAWFIAVIIWFFNAISVNRTIRNLKNEKCN